MTPFYTQGRNYAFAQFGLSKLATGSTGVGVTAPAVNASPVRSRTGSTVTGTPRDLLDDSVSPPPPMTSLSQPRS